MILHYLKLAWRNLKRNKLFSFINIFGLAISISLGIFILAMLNTQLKYDSFHLNKDEIFRLTSTREGYHNYFATTPEAAGIVLKENGSGIKNIGRLIVGLGGDLIYNQKSTECTGFFADPEILQVFNFPFKKGNPQYALQDPYSMVISNELAGKLFGQEDPLGKSVSFEELGLHRFEIGMANPEIKKYGTFKITGVVDELPQKSHVQFDLLVSASTIQSLVKQNLFSSFEENWGYYFTTYTYLRKDPAFTIERVEQQINANLKPNYQSLETKLEFALQPLQKIVLGPWLDNPISFTFPVFVFYFLGGLALVVLIIAGFNYTNLSIARSLSRAREIGIRKINGARKHQIIFQFLGESVFISLLALALSIGILKILTSQFEKLWLNQFFRFEFSGDFIMILSFVVFAILVGIISGLFPAFYIARIQPAHVFRGMGQIKPFKVPFLSKLSFLQFFTILQFTFSTIFIISTLVLLRQINHIDGIELGYETENIINLELKGNDFEIVKERLAGNSNVIRVSGFEYIPAVGMIKGFDVKTSEDQEKGVQFNYLKVDNDFIENLQIPMLAGQSFKNLLPAGDGELAIVSKSSIKNLDYNNFHEALGKTIYSDEGDIVIAGVMDDISINIPWRKEENVMLRYSPNDVLYANIRFLPGKYQETVGWIEHQWQQIDQVHMAKFELFDEQLKMGYLPFKDIAKVISFISFLAIIISCVGLLGIVTLESERKAKEIGIRKVLGAKTSQILQLMSRKLVILFTIVMIFSFPAAFYLNNFWLQNFASRINISFDIFLLGIGITLSLSLLAVALQTFRSANINPVDTLRNE